MDPRLLRLFLLAVAPLAAALPAAPGPVVAGQLEAPPNHEASGLAASRVNPGLLWIHDDSGGQAELYAVDLQGKLRGTLQIGGVKNVDWEDLAAARLDGRAWVVIADTGDNEAKRREVAIHFVAEPDLAQLPPAGRVAARPAATLRLRYPDGPRDCESLAVDPAERALYLLSKRDVPRRLYRVPLPSPLASAQVTAEFVRIVSQLPPPTAAQRAIPGRLGAFRDEPCAMDFTADGTAAVVLTYGDTVIFPRGPGETWAQALDRAPLRLPAHELPQAEAACFSVDGRQVFVASEKSRKLLRYDWR